MLVGEKLLLFFLFVLLFCSFSIKMYLWWRSYWIQLAFLSYKAIYLISNVSDFRYHYSKVVVAVVESLRSVQFFCNPTDWSPSGFSVRGILQARIVEWVSISFSRVSAQPRDQTHVSCLGRQILYHWATREAILRRRYLQKTKLVCNDFSLSCHLRISLIFKMPRKYLWYLIYLEDNVI